MDITPTIPANSLAAPAAPEIATNRRFAALYDAHAARVYGWCVRLCNGNVSDAEDLTQETFLAAFQSLPRVQSQARTTTWLYRIALRKWWAWRDSDSRVPRVPTGDDTGVLDALPDGINRVDASLERLRLEAALGALSPTLREAFLLVKAEGFTHREAARVLDVPTGTVQSRVHEATHKLRALLTESETAAFATHFVSTPAPKGKSRHAL